MSTLGARGGPSISLFTATCIVVANMIGTGVFTSLGFQVKDLPSGFAIICLWLIGGVCALCGALCYGELAAALPRSGGEYHFLSRTFHPAVGFLAGWVSATVGFAAPIALAAMAFAKYFTGVFPGWSPQVLSIAVAVFLTAVHLCGAEIGARFQNLATSLKVLLILGLITAGFTVDQTTTARFMPAEGDGTLILSAPFAVSLVFVMFSYAGWNAATYVTGEVRNPARNVPIALLVGTALVTILYMLLNAVFLRAAPVTEIAGEEDVALVAARHIFGERGGNIVGGLICFGLVSSISAMTWIGPRVAATMGEDFRALAWLSRRARNGVPATAMLVQLAIVVTLLATSTFAAVLTYVQFTLQMCSFLAVLGVFVLRRREPDLPRPVKTWGYPFTPLLFLAISAWMLWFLFADRPVESLSGLGTMLLGLIVYYLSPKRSL